MINLTQDKTRTLFPLKMNVIEQTNPNISINLDNITQNNWLFTINWLLLLMSIIGLVILFHFIKTNTNIHKNMNYLFIFAIMLIIVMIINYQFIRDKLFSSNNQNLLYLFRFIEIILLTLGLITILFIIYTH